MLEWRSPDGKSQREHLEVAARAGDKHALATLSSEPEYPEEVEYLMDWARMLHGRSGVGMAIAPLSPVVVESWARLMDLGKLHPLEVEALLLMDDALFYDPKTEQEPDKKDPVILNRPKWPRRERKGE